LLTFTISRRRGFGYQNVFSENEKIAIP
jgi:hypothetical protein